MISYYLVKPIIPRKIQLFLRRIIIRRLLIKAQTKWPIDEKAKKKPKNWNGWPDNKKFALILTHDVDMGKGQTKCLDLSNIEKKFGFRSSFNFVPERYRVNPNIRQQLINDGFEIGVHGLNHDGKLYQSRKVFRERAAKINSYLKEWRAVGFRSPAMHHNLEWIHDLNIEYDSSTFDTDPFEPQPDGVSTIYPFWVKSNGGNRGYAELPYTLPQDFTLFVLMKKKTIAIWKNKLDWIVEHGGMALLNTHPDYMSFSEENADIEEYPVSYYAEFLDYVRQRYDGQYWHILPGEIANYIKNAYHKNL